MTDVFFKKEVRTLSNSYYFNIYPTKEGMVAHSLDFDFLVRGDDRYDLQAKMEWLCRQQEMFSMPKATCLSSSN